MNGVESAKIVTKVQIFILTEIFFFTFAVFSQECSQHMNNVVFHDAIKIDVPV